MSFLIYLLIIFLNLLNNRYARTDPYGTLIFVSLGLPYDTLSYLLLTLFSLIPTLCTSLSIIGH